MSVILGLDGNSRWKILPCWPQDLFFSTAWGNILIPSFCFENSYLRLFALEPILIVYPLWRVSLEDLTYPSKDTRLDTLDYPL